MPQVRYMPRRRPAPPPERTPFDLVTVEVGGVAVQGRPVAFECAPDGTPLRPTAVTTMCPACTAGLELPLPEHGPPTYHCPHCGPAARPPTTRVDPFCNPFLEGAFDPGEADQDLVALLAGPVEGTVAERRAR